MKKRHLFTAVGLAGALSLTGVAFATTDTTSTVNISAQGFVNVAQAVTGKTDATGGTNSGNPPSWSPVAGSPGSITKGDLYTIAPEGTATSTSDMAVTVYLNNPGALTKDYNYLNMHVSVYKYDSTATPAWGTTAIATEYLTLSSGYVTFELPGLTSNTQAYGISVDDGNFYCISTSASSGSLTPNFYVTVKPA